MSNKKEGVKLIITIVERSQGNLITKLYDENQVSIHYQLSGIGTASSDLLDMLGFGTEERDILLSLAPTKKADRLMYNLNNDLRGSVECKGIAVDIPLTGLNNFVAAMLLKKEKGEAEDGGIIMEQGTKNSLILVVVNQGYTDTVMDTAKEAGARGGTIIRSRWVGAEHIEQFYGITLQEEKEIIAIVASSENRSAIMESINEKHGIKSEAGSIILSVGIEHMVRLG